MIEVVSATRLSESDFWNKSPLGISLLRLADNDQNRASRIAHITFANRRGLSEIYNQRILADDSGDLLVFIHDDVWIDDYFFGERISEGLRNYDVIGVAGNRRRLPNQPSWCFTNLDFLWDDPLNLSGAVAYHTDRPFGEVIYYGPTSANCELLDGVLLAVNKATLKHKEVFFDPLFDFHFYDMDFCRSARLHGLRLGTWPICLTHQSEGMCGTQLWHQKYQAYIEKWGD